MVVVGVIGLVSAATGGVEPLLRYGAPLVLFGVLGWAAFWRPYVEISDGGVVLANTLSTTHLPWPAIEKVDGRYGLALHTSYGTFTGWAAPAPAGRQRNRVRTSRVAEQVSERQQALRAAGHLDHPQLESAAPPKTWHRGLIAVLGVLVLATVTLPLLG
jgi:hypothetical protein